MRWPKSKKPTYDIDANKAVFSTAKKLNVTGTALKNAALLGFGRSEIAPTIQSIERPHFYKSMTSLADHRVWQDVYTVPSEVGPQYVKFTADVVTEFLLLSFKEKGHD